MSIKGESVIIKLLRGAIKMCDLCEVREKLGKVIVEGRLTPIEAVGVLETLKSDILLTNMDKKVFMREVAKEIKGGDD